MFYIANYLAERSAPGASQLYPLGWWGWSDQGRYLASAQALARGDFSAGAHFYPLGYALLGASFVEIWPMHPWFFVNLAGLLAAYLGFLSVARRFGVTAGWGTALFFLPLAHASIRQVWVVPWNSTPQAGLTWLLLAAIAADMVDPPALWRRLAIGLLAVSIPAIRPTDALVSAILVGGGGLYALCWRRLHWRGVAAVAIGGLAVAVPYLLLHRQIYGGLRNSEYMEYAGKLGFVLGDLPFKLFVMLEEPRPWFGVGEGMIQRMPWLVLGIAGALGLPLLLRGPPRWIAGLLALTIAAHAALYFSFIEGLPSTLWLYQNVHYYKWALPGCALLGGLLLRELWRGRGAPELSMLRRRAGPLLALAVTWLLLCVRLMPVPAEAQAAAGQTGVAANDRVRLAVFDGPALDWNVVLALYGASITDRLGQLDNVFDFRLVPDGGRLRAIALRRLFVGNIGWTPGHLPPGADPAAVPHRYAQHLGFGWPCALPPFPCRRVPLP